MTAFIERLLAHPRLPLLAAWDSERPAIHIRDRDGVVGVVGGDTEPYSGNLPLRSDRTPRAAWHPTRPLLAVAGEGGVTHWTPDGATEPDGSGYQDLAFSPDGGTLWAFPAAPDDWESSDAIDLATGSVTAGPAWDTGVAVHPAGGLFAALNSEQGATTLFFARSDGGRMRPLTRGIVLDADGYQTPVFSADGRYLAVWGYCYGKMASVFAFPSLRLAFRTTVVEPSPGFPPTPEWRARNRAWPAHTLAFGATLWLGTPDGDLIETDPDTRRSTVHHLRPGTGVTAVATTTSGDLAVALADGDLLFRTPTEPAPAADPATVADFLTDATEVPDGAPLWSTVTTTDGTRTWTADDHTSVTETTTADPAWLQIQAALNKVVPPD